MKKTITSLALAVALGFYAPSAFAGNSSVNKTSITEQVKEALRFPEFIKGETNKTKALVSFVIDENGKVQLREINAAKDVKEYLEEKFGNLSFATGTYEAGKEINMEINFRLI